MSITDAETGPYFTAPSNHQLPPPPPPKRAARRQLIHLMYAFVTCKRTHIYQGQQKKRVDRIERRIVVVERMKSRTKPVDTKYFLLA